MAKHPWVAEVQKKKRFGVGLVGLKGRTTEGGYTTYDEPAPVIPDAGQVAASLGLDVYIADDIVFAKAPQTFVMLGALEAATNQARLGTLVTSPTHQYPTHLARAFSDLDHLSNGRMILGLGIAANFDQFGDQTREDISNWIGIPYLSPPELQDRQAEAIEIIERLWDEDSISYDGHYYQLNDVGGIPRPVQDPRPPILVAGAGNRTLRQVAQYADACNFNLILDVSERIEYLERQCDEIGRPFDEILITDGNFMVIAPTEQELETKKRQAAPPEFFAKREELGIPAAGTPKSISEFFQKRFDAGIQYVIVVPFDSADHETMHLLATEIMPQFA